MKGKQKQDSQFISPYRQNRRCFQNYFRNFSNLDVSESKNSQQKRDNFLDNVSRASSIKFRQDPSQKKIVKQKTKQKQVQVPYFVISNKKKMKELQNPEIFQLLSKHIQPNEIKKKPKKILLKPVQSLLSERIKSKSFSVQQFEKAPKITEFTRQTFYRNNSSAMRHYSSKKQKQDNLHSKSQLQINVTKHTLCKKTRPNKQSCNFVTYEVYLLGKRVGVDVQILGGIFKQIKFRLIMNQNDTKTFNKHWSNRVDQFVDKCLSVTEDGILLKVGSFNIQNQNKKSTSRLKQMQRTYLQNYESFVKKQMSKKVTKKIGNIHFCQQYSPNQENGRNQETKNDQKYKKTEDNLKIAKANQQDLKQKKTENNQQKQEQIQQVQNLVNLSEEIIAEKQKSPQSS